MNIAHLFVYGTLRAGFDDPMARCLRSAARLIGPARARGALYRVAAYPGFVPGGEDWVTGDLFALTDAAATLAWLDDYEECAPHFPHPHEYRRARLTVAGPDGPVDAWTYIYARAVAGLDRIDGGDFLSEG
ncbi:gamma-glutamylcyclotransferase family protein [Sphingobium sp. CAP-1]|uniref:gamma-glutamylcyclotransferase family protein n=1 Tax=Sphingobium sp. CAP-1 TaxID=2676077 RepID=UPI0012BB2F4F|nr:gamma-glutamylcyclotransferase family protein [Sphingobium sp. CAP-1]QGP79295.1 gamma-glutamylcyclotransferase [Sphingobium sp. CAP-1]